MYAMIWRLLPGPRWLRIVEATVLALAVVFVLMQWVFPWLAPLLPFQQQTVGE